MRWNSWVVALVVLLGCGGEGVPREAPAPAVSGEAPLAPAVCGNGILEAGELCDGTAPLSCTSLSPLYTAGRTVCASNCQGYEVARDCTRRTGIETLRPAVRDASRWGDARCNDGSPFAFTFSPSGAGSKVWVIHLEGGGFCDGYTMDCVDRGTRLSSQDMAADRTLGTPPPGRVNLLSRNTTDNPTFAQANHVFAHYCSSDLWSGTQTRTQPVDHGLQLYFSGRLNARALLELLRRDYGLDDRDPALQVLWTGQSAGGQGAQNTADLAARALPNARSGQRLWVIADAGWRPLNWTHPDYTQGGVGELDPAVFERMTTLYQAEFSAECRTRAQALGRPASACFAGLPAVTSLLLPTAQGGLGLRVLAAINRRDPMYTGNHGLTDTSAQTNAAMQQWDEQLTRELLDSGVRWLFSPSDDPRTGTNELHVIQSWWQVPFKAYSAAHDVCGTPYTVRNYRDLVTRFFEDPSPDTSRLRVCFNGEWLP